MSLIDPTESRPRLPSLGQAVALLNDALDHRRELASLEWAEARGHAQHSLVLAGLVALLVALAGLMLSLAVAGAVWESPHRVWWLAGIGGAQLAAAAIAIVVLRRRFRSWQPLAEIRNQLQLDHQCLRRLIQTLLP